ncbi:Sec-independent protein translocase subunit TatA/TatB [Halobacterium bonnevillei]|uniref:Sec-independent protein translocase protein TatA n=1 Tax=Halobacterium bonnevillei TaxID=2692200 RepID=A0A6B0SKZ1_9EURY|nr:twin-arginine translocase TatA/TatE family subunit [Halobacterium bonnevillei]MXR20381.1 twin-arginine translocase TatA/TatE family subunit [Halobacterium bonnevillei]
MFTSTPLFVGGLPGGMEWAVILLIAVLLFGANKIPKLARSSGQAIGEFQKGREEVESELEEMRDGADPTVDADEDTTLESSADTTETASADTTEDTSTDTESASGS